MKMKKKTISLLALACAGVCSLSLLVGGVTYAAFERYAKVVDEDGNAIPFATDGYRNTSIYVIPTAWNYLLSGGSSVADCYIACCFFKADDSAYEWQFIKTCDSGKTLISENRTSITVSATNYNAYRFSLDLTYYDRFSFHRIGYTANLEAYMGSAVNKFTCKSTDTNPVPLDWRNKDDSPAYKRYDATHRQTRQATSNVFEITSTNSGGTFGYLAWGEWKPDAIVE